ncbi:LysM peptidoglycan-binding domain-containing protein [Actinomycetaceae bacterium L2_0104]
MSSSLRVWDGVDLAIKVAAALLVVVAVAVAAIVLGVGTASTVGDVVVVQAGDTLWSVASAVPGAPSVSTAVADIQELNGLGSSALSVGQDLLLPRY